MKQGLGSHVAGPQMGSCLIRLELAWDFDGKLGIHNTMAVTAPNTAIKEYRKKHLACSIPYLNKEIQKEAFGLLYSILK